MPISLLFTFYNPYMGYVDLNYHVKNNVTGHVYWSQILLHGIDDKMAPKCCKSVDVMSHNAAMCRLDVLMECLEPPAITHARVL